MTGGELDLFRRRLGGYFSLSKSSEPCSPNESHTTSEALGLERRNRKGSSSDSHSSNSLTLKGPTSPLPVFITETGVSTVDCSPGSALRVCWE
jgi:hypothetical protein